MTQLKLTFFLLGFSAGALLVWGAGCTPDGSKDGSTISGGALVKVTDGDVDCYRMFGWNGISCVRKCP